MYLVEKRGYEAGEEYLKKKSLDEKNREYPEVKEICRRRKKSYAEMYFLNSLARKLIYPENT
jgi:hypothetical protein